MWKNEGWAALEAAVAVAQEKIVAQLERLADQEHALALRDVLCGVADRELRVVIFGEFNTGKSTLINALLGRRALVAKARPTTGQVTRVIRGHPERVVVTFDDERTEQCDLASVETFTLLDVHSKARDDIRCINVFVDVPTLPEDVILIDTPGLADRPEQTHRATREAATADLVLILLDATHLLGLSERRLASDWLACDLEKPVVPVLNFMNNVEPAERKEIRQLMTEWSCQLPRTPFSSRYFEVNALAALRNALGIEAAGLANDDFQQLAKELHGLGGVRANNLRLKSRCSHLGTVLRSADTKNREALKLLQKDAEGVRREREIQLHNGGLIRDLGDLPGWCWVGRWQNDLVVTWKEMPRSPGHVFYDRLQGVLIDAGFDAFAETTCKPYYAAKMGCAVASARPVLPHAHGRLLRACDLSILPTFRV